MKNRYFAKGKSLLGNIVRLDERFYCFFKSPLDILLLEGISHALQKSDSPLGYLRTIKIAKIINTIQLFLQPFQKSFPSFLIYLLQVVW